MYGSLLFTEDERKGEGGDAVFGAEDDVETSGPHFTSSVEENDNWSLIFKLRVFNLFLIMIETN